MATSEAVTAEPRGPFCYENWQRALAGEEWQWCREYPFFSDAHIVGEEADGYGPYQFLNGLAGGNRHYPAIFLRVYEYTTGGMPQMEKTEDFRYHGGLLQDEIAALVSLCLGIRLKSGESNRVFGANGDPKGHPESPFGSENPFPSLITRRPVLPWLLGEHNLNGISLVASLPRLMPACALAIVRAARMYQEAVWVAESAPELTWLLLTSAIETAAQAWRNEEDSPLERMRASRPELEPLLREHGGDQLVERVAQQIAPYMGATRTFVDFILEFLPEPPAIRPWPWAQLSWEPQQMKKVLRRVYQYRSVALHGGKPFPAPMCLPPDILAEHQVAEVPTGLASATRGGTWLAQDVPVLLHTFEYISRGALLRWWESLVPNANQLS